jgi:hypothetical protein
VERKSDRFCHYDKPRYDTLLSSHDTILLDFQIKSFFQKSNHFMGAARISDAGVLNGVLILQRKFAKEQWWAKASP